VTPGADDDAPIHCRFELSNFDANALAKCGNEHFVLRMRQINELPEELRFKAVFVNAASGILPDGIKQLPSMDHLKVIDATVPIHLDCRSV